MFRIQEMANKDNENAREAVYFMNDPLSYTGVIILRATILIL
jgi:hypothetical protein